MTLDTKLEEFRQLSRELPVEFVVQELLRVLAKEATRAREQHKRVLYLETVVAGLTARKRRVGISRRKRIAKGHS